MVAENTHEGDQAAAPLDQRQRTTTRTVRRGGGEEDEIVAQGTRVEAVPAARVPDADLEALPGRRAVPGRLEPDGQAGAAAGGVDDEICVYPLLRAPVDATDDVGPHDASTIRSGGQSYDVPAAQEADPGQRQDPAANRRLEDRSTHADGGQSGPALSEPKPAEADAGVREHVADRSARLDELGREPGEQLLEHVVTSREQPVQMACLWSAATRPGGGAEQIPVDDDHLGVGLGEHAGREQPGDAPAEDDGAVSVLGVMAASSTSVSAGSEAARDSRSFTRSRGVHFGPAVPSSRSHSQATTRWSPWRRCRR